jgi:site-specific DNA-methyltransferase (adenine-specific)
MKEDNFEELLDDCYISNNDSLKITKLMKDNSIDLILTDPPYNIGKFMHDRNTNMGKLRKNHFSATDWDNLEFDEWVTKMDEFLEESARIIKYGGSMIIFMSLIKIETIIKLAEKHKFYYKTTGIWHKKNPMPRNMNLHFINSTEAWIYFTFKKRTGVFNNNNKAIHDFFETGLTPKNEKRFGSHPTQKPEKLIETFVKLLSNKGDIIFDPFMGSGTIGKVALNLDRIFYGIEISKEYYEITKKRLGQKKLLNI